MNMMAETYCTATLNYAGTEDYLPTRVDILDGRSADIDYDTTGFTLLNHRTAVEDWLDMDEVARIHEPEIKALAEDFLGCRHALVYPPLVRSPLAVKASSDYAPILSVHNDYTEDYRRMVTNPEHTYAGFLGPLLERHGLTYADVQGAPRISVIQFWRNIGDPHPDHPLAVMDASSSRRDEMIPIAVPVYAGMALDFEAFAVRPPEETGAHRWYTYPGMALDEVLAFRTYDSACEDAGKPFWTAHTAFRDPLVGDDAPLRASVEMRALCLF